LERYDGLWYEIASTPFFFEIGCFCTTATYTILTEDTIRVFNACNRFRPRGKLRTIEGTAALAGEGAEGKLLVTFPGPPVPADYWIVDVVEGTDDPDAEYSFAAVGGPNRDFLFILARDPVLDTPEEQAAYQDVLARLEAQFFDTSALKSTPHPFLCSYEGRE
jgi:lipocalin